MWVGVSSQHRAHRSDVRFLAIIPDAHCGLAQHSPRHSQHCGIGLAQLLALLGRCIRPSSRLDHLADGEGVERVNERNGDLATITVVSFAASDQCQGFE
jgi:hypothetical protein